MISELNNLLENQFKRSQVGGVYILDEQNVPNFPKTRIRCSCQILVCKFEGHNFLNFFQNVSGAKSVADYVAFVPHKNKIFVFIIELSTTKKKARQYEPTKTFVKFVEATYNRINNFSIEFHYRYIVLTIKAANKGLTKPGKTFSSEKANMKAGLVYNLSNYCH